MGENFDDHRRIFDGGDDLQAAAAVRPMFNVDVEDPFEQPGPTQARRRVIACGRSCYRPRLRVGGVDPPGSSPRRAAVPWGADQRKELEHLCRYITRPAIANERLKLNRAGQVVLQLKSPYKDGTTHIVMEPLEFMERLAARAAFSGENTIQVLPRSSISNLRELTTHNVGLN